jgi:hypothetical protein
MSKLAKNMALRVDASRGPATETKSCGEQALRAARGLRSRSKITPQESAKHVRGQCFARPASEDVIWQSEVRLKVVAGGAPLGRTIRHVYFGRK